MGEGFACAPLTMYPDTGVFALPAVLDGLTASGGADEPVSRRGIAVGSFSCGNGNGAVAGDCAEGSAAVEVAVALGPWVSVEFERDARRIDVCRASETSRWNG